MLSAISIRASTSIVFVESGQILYSRHDYFVPRYLYLQQTWSSASATHCGGTMTLAISSFIFHLSSIHLFIFLAICHKALIIFNLLFSLLYEELMTWIVWYGVLSQC